MWNKVCVRGTSCFLDSPLYGYLGMNNYKGIPQGRARVTSAPAFRAGSLEVETPSLRDLKVCSEVRVTLQAVSQWG